MHTTGSMVACKPETKNPKCAQNKQIENQIRLDAPSRSPSLFSLLPGHVIRDSGVLSFLHIIPSH